MSLYLGDIPIANDGSHRLTGEIGDMGFAPLGIDESLNLRRYLNGQVISQTQFVAFTTKVKSAVALFPNLGTTEANWQAEKALSKFGQVGKFVIDDENQTIRLPAVVNAQGLLSLSGIGNLVNESLPNIKESVPSSVMGDFGNAPNSGSVFEKGGTTAYKYAGGNYGANSGFDFNVSRKYPVYQDGAPVQQEAIQYPYYIQVATGVEETLPAIREYKVNNSDYFGKSMYSDVVPDNASWLASNGSYNARAVYPDYYDWLNGKIGQVITANGGKVVLSTGTYTDYDFVVNQNDQTFRLPLLNGEEDLPSDRVESLTVQATGADYTASANGTVFFVSTSTSTNQFVALQNNTCGVMSKSVYSSASGQSFKILLDVKRGDSFKVSYQTSPLYLRLVYAKGNGTLYYYVGDTVQDASLINAGAVLGQLSNKADIDLNNVNNTGNVAASNLNSKGIRTVVETYKNGNNWYRVWSDGWIEQGGNDIGTSFATLRTINFHKAFANAGATVILGSSGANNTGGYSAGISSGITTTGFSYTGLSSANNSANSTCWYACGY